MSGSYFLHHCVVSDVMSEICYEKFQCLHEHNIGCFCSVILYWDILFNIRKTVESDKHRDRQMQRVVANVISPHTLNFPHYYLPDSNMEHYPHIVLGSSNENFKVRLDLDFGICISSKGRLRKPECIVRLDSIRSSISSAIY